MNDGMNMMDRIVTHRVLGRPYVLALLEARPRKIRRNNKVYIQYTVNLPKKLVEILVELDKMNPDLDSLLGEEEAREPEPIPLTVLVTPSPWHHLVDWDDMSARAYLQLPEKIRRELEALGLGPVPEKERVLVPIPPGKLRELDLDPDKPITYEDLEEAIRRKLQAELRAQGDGSEGRVAPARASLTQR